MAEDINECSYGLHNCSHVCVNTQGGHSCHCHPGFKTDPQDANKCLDVDECRERPAPCDHICHNEPGSFHCHCQQGFSLGADRRRCVKN